MEVGGTYRLHLAHTPLHRLGISLSLKRNLPRRPPIIQLPICIPQSHKLLSERLKHFWKLRRGLERVRLDEGIVRAVRGSYYRAERVEGGGRLEVRGVVEPVVDV